VASSPLLEGAVGHAHAMGAAALEGYPVDPAAAASIRPAITWVVPLFEAHGFSRLQDAG
jgi:hypothetical protein